MAALSSTPKPRSRWRLNKNKVNLWLDILLALAFVVDLEFRFTGLTIHEWLGVVLGIVFIIHIILHWSWIVSITKTFFRKLWHDSRLNYVLNWLLFIDMALIIVTGIGISRTLGLNLSLGQQVMRNFEQLHRLGANFSLMIVGFHVALHWKWMAQFSKQYLFWWAFPRRAVVAPVKMVSQNRMGGD